MHLLSIRYSIVFTQSTGCKQREVSGNKCRTKALIHVMLRFLCCITSFLSSLFESDSNTGTYYVRGNLRFCAAFLYFLHDAHLPECFELQFIFSFEQKSLGSGKKTSLTSLITNAEKYAQHCLQSQGRIQG